MEITNQLQEKLEDKLFQPNLDANLGSSERMLSIASGSFLVLKGITNIFSHPLIAITEIVIGGVLLNRGVSGYCEISDSMEAHSKHTKSSLQNLPASL